MTDKRESVENVAGGSPQGGPAAAGGVGAADDREPGIGQLLLLVHTMLRGRYVLLAALSLVLAGGLAYGGFRLGHKTYRSTAVIQIVKPISVGDVDSGDANDEATFVATQAGLIKSQRAIDLAMANPAWQALARPVTESSAEEFTNALAIAHKDRMIYVSFEDRDPRAVIAGLRSVVDAYERQYKEDEVDRERKRHQIVQGREIALNGEDGELKREMDEIQGRRGTNDLSSMYMTKYAQRERLDDLHEEIKARLALMPKKPAAAPEVQVQKELQEVRERFEVEQLAQTDSELRDLLAERVRRQRELNGLTQVGTLGKDHPRVLVTKEALQSAEREIQKRVADLRLVNNRPKAPAISPAIDAAELETKLAQVARMRDDARNEEKQLGAENIRLKWIHERRAVLQEKLAPLQKWLEQMNIRDMLGGNRYRVLGTGTAPTATVDTRVRLAAAGAFLGLALAFGLSVLPALVDRRFHAADDTRVTNYLGPVLGVLPGLPGGASDDENAAMAAYCVHHTRMLLQMRHHHGALGQALAITSSVAGTGKTSLTLALGVSFATSGSRTLIVDCDLVGGGLSTRVSRMTRRKIGDLLRRDGVLSEEQLERALVEMGRGGDRRLGETCVELGMVGEADLERALEAQDGAHLGVLDALAGEPLADCVAETGFPGLHVLPLGSASARHCASISPAALRRLLKVARGKYDTVLIDTGPVPGSLEASVVVPQADGVVLVVSKGEHRPTVARCVEHLRSIGATTLGVVFNRASLKEVSHNASTLHRSTAAFGSSSSSSSSSGMGLRVDAEQARRSHRLGPVARAVAGCAPTTRDSDAKDADA